MTTIHLPSFNSSTTVQPPTLDDRIQEAIAHARALCSEHGIDSSTCAVAWDIVEELQAEAAHRRAASEAKTYFTDYCDEYPDAPEARIYDI